MRKIDEQWVDGRLFIVAAGDSEETKPTDNICDGSVFTETDTGTTYIFSEADNQWNEWLSGS